MDKGNTAKYYCSSFLGVLGMYEHADMFASGKDVVTLYFPQDTQNEYPDYTLAHELTHRALVQGSLVGNLQQFLSSSKEISDFSNDNLKSVLQALKCSIDSSRIIQESVATYIGFINQALTDGESLNKIYGRLPTYYRSCLSLLEAVLPSHRKLPHTNPNLYRNVVITLGRYSLNTQVISKLIDSKTQNVENLYQIIAADNPDQAFRSLVQEMYRDKTILDRLLDVVEQTLREYGFQTSNEYFQNATNISMERFETIFLEIDHRLMEQHKSIFKRSNLLVVSGEERQQMLNTLIQKWNQNFQKNYSHPLFSVNQIIVAKRDSETESRIRIRPHPEAVSGKRTFSNEPTLIIDPIELLYGIAAAKSVGLWIQARIFVNPGNRQLSLGDTFPSLDPNTLVIIFYPFIPEKVQTDSERERYGNIMKSMPPFCRMQTCITIPNTQLPIVLNYLNDLTLLWHIDWIMYHYASLAKISFDDLPGSKYIHMDNADDETFFNHIRSISKNGQITAYIQKLGQETLTVATFYRDEVPVYFSIPLASYKVAKFLEAVKFVGGQYLGNVPYYMRKDSYKNDIAMLFHYGL